MDILVADDENDIRVQVCEILEDEGYSVRSASTIAEALTLINQRLPALAIIDVWFRHCEKDGLSLLEELLGRREDLPVIMISGHSTVDMAVRAVKTGAHDFMTKPFALESLLHSVEQALHQATLWRENKEMALKLGQIGPQVGPVAQWSSLSMQAVMKQIEQWAGTERRMMICGEAGSGKSQLALEIHRRSRRAHGPFLRHHCHDYDDEQEHQQALWGREGGAVGKIELAHGGTLLLEHVERLSPALQSMLANFMQTQRFHRIGGDQKVEADVRLLAISGLSMDGLQRHSLMNKTFLELISLGVIALPALRQRPEDIPALVEQIKVKLAHTQGNGGTADQRLELTEEGMTALSAHSWPQNIRELENVLTRLYWSGGTLGRAEIERAIGEEITQQQTDSVQHWRRLISRLDLPLRGAREVFEAHYLRYHLERFSGNVSQTAQYVGMDRASLHRKMRSLGCVEVDQEHSATDEPKAGE